MVVRTTGKLEGIFTRVVEPILRYFRETRAELRKVSWPSRQTAWNLTLIVLGATVAMAIILGVADTVFADIMRGIVNGSGVGILAGAVVVIGGAVAVYFIQRE